MDDDQKELAKIAAESALKPFANLIEKLFGGAAEQVGGMWTDSLSARRHFRRIKIFEKLKHKIENAGFDPKSIPDRIWLPALQEASLEDCRKVGPICWPTPQIQPTQLLFCRFSRLFSNN